MFSRIAQFSAVLVTLAYAAAATSTTARALEDVEMGTIGGPSAVLWPIYIGVNKRMFAAENLNIKLTFVPSSAGVQQQLAAGALEISDAGLNDQVRAIFEGAPIALVRIEGQVPPYALLSQPAIKEKFAPLGVLAQGSTPQELAAKNAGDAVLWEPIIKEANIKVE